MNAFEYAAPKSLDEAVSLLSPTRGETAVLAGGTDLVTSLKQRIAEPKRVVSLRYIEELKGIDASGDRIRIGAMTTLEELAKHEAISSRFPAVVRAIEGIASQQIIAVGTVGGDLCLWPRCWYFRQGFGLLAKHGDTELVPPGDNRYHAIFGNDGAAKFVSASSLAPALIALGATLTVRGANNASREIKAAAFFKTPTTGADGITDLAPDEILTHIVIPAKAVNNATYEVRERQGLDWPLVAASVAFDSSGGTVKGARVVLGHVAPVPWVSEASAAALEGKKTDETAATAAGEAAVKGARPLSMNEYKVQLAKVAVKRAVLAAANA
jgi:xanthine dehydrogenase YagS FAD-binding subunit